MTGQELNQLRARGQVGANTIYVPTFLAIDAGLLEDETTWRKYAHVDEASGFNVEVRGLQILYSSSMYHVE
jgi:hypothetical protein